MGGLIKVSVYAVGLYAEEAAAAARLQGEQVTEDIYAPACLSIICRLITPLLTPVLEPDISASLVSHQKGHHPPPEYYEALLAPVQWPRALYLHFTRYVHWQC